VKPPTNRTAALRAICAEVGFDLDQATPALVERMWLLAEYSQTFDDAVRMAGYARQVFAYYEAHKPSEAFTPSEQRQIVLACLFSDIGKTGPAHADRDGQRLIVEMFSIEGVRDETMPVATFFRTYFPNDAEDRIARFTALGLDPALTLRQFWNLHSGWTLDIAETASVPLDAVAAAATHHYLDNVNPQSIVGADHRFTRAFGENTAFDRAEKLIIILDKYDAVRRRGHLDHDAAIAWLRDRISKNPRFRDDAELATLIGDVEIVLRPTSS
jgi:hypothetical protein